MANIYRPGDAISKVNVLFGAANILKPITTFIIEEGVVDKKLSPEGPNDSVNKKKRAATVIRNKVRYEIETLYYYVVLCCDMNEFNSNEARLD